MEPKLCCSVKANVSMVTHLDLIASPPNPHTPHRCHGNCANFRVGDWDCTGEVVMTPVHVWDLHYLVVVASTPDWIIKYRGGKRGEGWAFKMRQDDKYLRKERLLYTDVMTCHLNQQTNLSGNRTTFQKLHCILS